MRAGEFLLEYDRERARQVLGNGLWLARLADMLGVQGSSLDDIRREAEASEWGADVLSNPDQQRKLANSALEQIEDADPSTNKKYTQWMARQYMTSEPAMEDVTSTLADYVAKFHRLNTMRKLPPGENDINRYKTARQLYLVMDRYPDPVDVENDKGRARKEYEDADVVVIVPEDETAACRYGRQTRWCTAAVHGSNYFEHYNNRGPLYILIPKSPTHDGEKYQLHFATSQFMDEGDDPIEIGKLLKKRFPGLLEFFMGKPDVAEHIREMVQFASDELLQRLSDEIWEITQEKVYDILADWEANDESYYQFLSIEGYTTDDGVIDWDRNPPPYTEYNDEARRWSMDMEEYCNPRPAAIRSMAATQVSDGTFDEDSIYNVEGYISHNLRWEMRKEHSAEFIADWIDRNISIKPGTDGPKVVRIKRDVRRSVTNS